MSRTIPKMFLNLRRPTLWKKQITKNPNTNWYSMIQPAIHKGILFAFFISITLFASAQVKPIRNTEPVSENTNSRKPFRILTNGKKITVQGTSNISKILVWTSSGYRIVEQTNLNTSNYSFQVPVKENIFFLLLEFTNGKRYTEKIGVK